jgi:low affinity Fe/Cu permease
MNEAFRKIAHRAAVYLGTPVAFCAAAFIIIIWGTSGFLFDFSDTWQLVINTATTIVTFLMVFLIQNTQNRDSRELHLKLDDLILTTRGADDRFAQLETLSDEQLEQLQRQIETLSERRSHRAAGRQAHAERIGQKPASGPADRVSSKPR